MLISRQDLFNEIKFYKEHIKVTNTELQNFLNYLDQTVFNKKFFFCSPDRATASPAFSRAFKTLSSHQQIDYYLICLKILFELKGSCVTQDEEGGYERVDLEYRDPKKNWKKTVVLISYKQVMIQIEALKTKFKLENYIFRISKDKHKKALVLESTREDTHPTTFRLAPSEEQEFENLLLKMRRLAKTGLRIKIAKMLGRKDVRRQTADTCFQSNECLETQLFKSGNPERNSLRRMLKASHTPEYQISSKEQCQEEIQTKVIDKGLLKELDNFEFYKLIREGFYIHKNEQKIRKRHIYDQNQSFEWLCKELTNHENYKIWKNSVSNISLLGDLPKENSKVYHEINSYKDGSSVDYVYIRHRSQRQDGTFFIDKSISTSEYGCHQTLSSRGKIQYCIWRVKKIENKKIEVLVECHITHIPSDDVYQAMNEHVGELENLVKCKKVIEKGNRMELKKAVSFFDLDDCSFSRSVSADEASRLNMQTAKKSSGSFNQEDSCFYSILDSEFGSIAQLEEGLLNLNVSPIKKQMSSKNCITYQIKPSKYSQKQFKAYINDKFFDSNECVPSESGELLFTNQQKIKAQGGVLVGVLKRMSANLFSGKSILNVSLPIQIFSADTNIERLCKGMAYAPHFLQNKVDVEPVERMKAAVCFSLGTLILYIDMAKPFNPILGQTYQAFIDGCPIYGQQTSHHPPISSLFMVGRDYFISANLEAKVELGLNSASGSNAGEYRIAFNKSDPTKNIVTFTSPAGELSGVVYGDRRLNLVNKNRYYDAENNLFLQIKWGKGKSKNSLSKFNDYFEGKIVKLASTFPNINKVKESDKDTMLGVISGRWTQSVYFNDELIFDINEKRPFLVTDEKNVLKSDARERQDRKLLQKGNLEESQNAKEQLQDAQRRDRKLRKEHTK